MLSMTMALKANVVVSPVLEAVQVSLPFVLLKMPAVVPANSVALLAGSIAIENTFVFVRPVFDDGVQVVPEFVLLLTPKFMPM